MTENASNSFSGKIEKKCSFSQKMPKKMLAQSRKAYSRDENGRFSNHSVISFLRSLLGQKEINSTLLGKTLSEKKGEYAN